jgi:hypothetical protein
MVRGHAEVLDREHLPGAAEPRLDLVDDEQDPVLVAQVAQARHELLRRDVVAALALDGLDEDRRHVLRRADLPEDPLPEEPEVVVDRVADVGEEGGEVAPLRRLRRRERQRPHRPPVEPVEERDEPRPLRDVARELHRGLDRLRPRVREEALLGAGARHEAADLLREVRHHPVVEVGPRHVDELRGLVGERLRDLGVDVAEGVDRDAGREVEEPVAVGVEHEHPLAAVDDERVGARVARRDELVVARDDRAGLGAGRGDADVGTERSGRRFRGTGRSAGRLHAGPSGL